MVVWDIENVRPPPLIKRNRRGHALTPAAVLQEVKRAFVTDAGYAEHAAVCCLTSVSLQDMERTYPSFVQDLVLAMDVRVGSRKCPKLAADFVLKREMARFVHRHAGQEARIVLLTGDADFLEPVQLALLQGIDVQLVYQSGSVARTLLSLPYASPPVEWGRFLEEKSSSS